MSRLIDDMLTFSRAGRQELVKRQVDANLLVREALLDFADDIKTRQIAVTIEELPRIVCDQAMIRNVFANLLSNAVKYTGKTPRAAIAIGFDKQKNAIFIKDNGIGFDMKYHDKIFQVFQRLQLPEDYEGTGIGLAIAKRIVERHNGSIWAESASGQGSTFFMVLPAGPAANKKEENS
jgi:light-regulated signal transduction histidine kinase (bacteriophytochrome)